MEESRLKPMVANYDPAQFKDIYDRTEGLRRKLAAGIDARRFGVDYEEILSWFTVKFIFAYNKYCEKYDTEILLGHMIKAMQFFKIRIIKAAYTIKFSQSIVEFTGNEHGELFTDDPREDKEIIYEEVMAFLKNQISDNAYMLLQLKINPPPYIWYRMGSKSIHKIPKQLIAEYFGLDNDDASFKYIDNLTKEIQMAMESARSHFN